MLQKSIYIYINTSVYNCTISLQMNSITVIFYTGSREEKLQNLIKENDKFQEDDAYVVVQAEGQLAIRQN